MRRMQHVLELDRDWVTIEEAMALVDRSRRTIYRWKDEGIVRTEKPRKRVYFNRSDLIDAEAAAYASSQSSDTT